MSFTPSQLWLEHTHRERGVGGGGAVSEPTKSIYTHTRRVSAGDRRPTSVHFVVHFRQREPKRDFFFFPPSASSFTAARCLGPVRRAPCTSSHQHFGVISSAANFICPPNLLPPVSMPTHPPGPPKSPRGGNNWLQPDSPAVPPNQIRGVALHISQSN